MPGAAARPRRGRLLLVMVALLAVMPLAEIAVIIAVARGIGGWPTVGLLAFESLLGAWLVRREGATTWRALSGALQSGRMPARELADGALVLVGGVLLLTPGFLTDLLGFLLIAPFTRPVARRLLQATVERRLLSGSGFPGPYAGSGGGDVIKGETVER